MTDIYKSIKRHTEKLEEQIDELKSFLSSAPEGYLTCEKRGNAVRYHLQGLGPAEKKKSGRKRKNENSENRRSIYIKREDAGLALDLAKKRYYENLCVILEKERVMLRNLLKFYDAQRKEKTFESMNSYRKEMLDPIYAFPDTIAERWEKEKFETKEIAEGKKKFRTMRGESVRSKSEKIIADSLFFSDVPYKYERPLKLRGYAMPIYPDFTVLNKRTGEEFYWEHLGMIDDVDYYSGLLRRLGLYAMNGIYPGEKLIVTYESTEFPLSTESVEHNIEEFLR